MLISHPDFVVNDDDQIGGFVEGVERGWAMVKRAQKFDEDMAPVIAPPPESDKRVQVWFSYGENGLGVRRAEEAVAAVIATISFHVAHMNHTGMNAEVMPAYGFEIVRDVEAPGA